jgi:diguanylate cyclase (GGDEF)-like protein
LKDLYLIGEFSEETGVSRRMLRHYDSIGLLKPLEVDDITGYRYYADEQKSLVRDIVVLKQLGFSLSQIQDILDSKIDAAGLLHLLKDREAELRIAMRSETDVLRRIQSLINIITSCPQVPSKNLIQQLLAPENDLHRRTIMEEKGTMEQDKEESVQKKLKKLPGPDLFMEKIEKKIAESSKGKTDYYMISCDIDNFFSVNEEFGVSIGDRVILAVMDIILNEFPDDAGSHFLCSRLGGDELGVFAVNSDLNSIIMKIDKVFDKIRDFDFETIGCSRKIRLSAGIYKVANVGHLAELRHNSVKALMEAKRQGGDCYHMISA